ncbi:MAG: hypothetical protein ACJAZM_001106 [Cyclobacteriaceae bacterium]|jgi:hypothetical protein
MIGIDVIDLEDELMAERDQRASLLIKHPNDSKLDHPLAFWLLWTAKEALFKCQRTDTRYRPTDIPIILNTTGLIENGFRSEREVGYWEVFGDHIIAVAHPANLQLHVACIKDSTCPEWSKKVRDHLGDLLAKQSLSVGASKQGLPIVKESKAPITLSHHRRFAAFAYPIETLN